MNEMLAQAGAAPGRDRAATYDEMVNGAGAIRGAWQGLIGALGAIAPAQFAERIERARRQYEENGVAYNVYNEAVGARRRWRFDLVPLAIAADEWARLELGLIQRVRLINLALADLYGPRRLIAEGHCPAALLHANGEFLRPCDAIVPAGGAPFVAFYAADLARGPDGQWRVVADRTQAPAGLGYALENRAVMARTMPDVVRSTPLRRLTPFVEVIQASLAALAPRHRDNPRIVLLTAGQYSETYYEHVFLARQFGITLVEGPDLTVREARVFLKTLDGLQPVDVILRRLDDDFCDPLELRGESLLGVAGLLTAVRAGNVVIANALGAGLAESPALMAAWPAISRALLGEDLMLPSIETRWLGGAGAREAIERLDDYVLRPIASAPREAPIDPATLDQAARAALQARLAALPGNFLAQAKLVASSMPIWTEEGLSPRAVGLRVFLVAHEGSWIAMPGGLARVSDQAVAPLALHDADSVAKDVWALAAEGGDVLVAQRAPAARLILRRSAGELQSRVADNLFWLGRYAERLDNAARLFRAALSRLSAGGMGPRERVELQMLMHLLAERGLVPPSLAATPPESGVLTMALSRATGRGQPMQDIVGAIDRLAPAVRDRLSSDMWKVVSELMGAARDRLERESGDVDRMLEAIDQLIEVVAAMGGMAQENMTRGSLWRFLDLGRRTERAGYVLAVIRGVMAMPGAADEASLRLALELCDSAITYRSRYLAALQAMPVLDLVLIDESNPRSLAFQLAAIADHFDRIGARGERPFGRPEQRLAYAALSAVRLFPIEDVGALAENETRDRVEAFIEATGQHVRELSDAITRSYFSHIKSARAIGYAAP